MYTQMEQRRLRREGAVRWDDAVGHAIALRCDDVIDTQDTGWLMRAGLGRAGGHLRHWCPVNRVDEDHPDALGAFMD